VWDNKQNSKYFIRR